MQIRGDRHSLTGLAAVKPRVFLSCTLTPTTMSSLVAFWLASYLIVTTAWPLEQVPGVNLFSALRNGHSLLSFTTKTSTLTETYVTTQWLPSVVCAKLVNVTGTCKQHFQDSPEGRIAQMEEPVVLTFDDETEEADSFAQFNPTMTLK